MNPSEIGMAALLGMGAWAIVIMLVSIVVAIVKKARLKDLDVATKRCVRLYLDMKEGEKNEEKEKSDVLDRIEKRAIKK